MSFALWFSFFSASLLLAVAPGPDNLFVITQSAVYGVRAGLCVVFGFITGLVLHTVLAACGVAAMVVAVPALLWTIKLVGATYLLYLAWGAWMYANDAVNGAQAVALRPIQLWRRGFIMNVTNPKVQIFFLAFFPQFVMPGTKGVALASQMLIQGATFMLATLIVFSALACLAGAAADWLCRPRWRAWLSRASAVIFVTLAGFALVG